MKIPFVKAEATGNDFIFIPEKYISSKEGRASLVEKVCDRHFGVGSDGVVFWEKYDVEGERILSWRFFNADGIEANMCGNASRAVGAFAKWKWDWENFVLKTRSGSVEISAKGSDVYETCLEFLSPEIVDYRDFSEEFLADVFRSAGSKVVYLNVGVPHFVVYLDKGEPQVRPLQSLVSQLRFSLLVNNEGANVTALSGGDERSSTFYFETFERGVEDWTLSCGTGALAAAYFIWTEKKVPSVQLQSPGGNLEVFWSQNNARLKGEAHVVCEGTYNFLDSGEV